MLGALVPFFAEAALVPCVVGSKCTACDLFKLADNVIKFLIAVGILLATIGVVWAGFLMLTAGGDPGKVEKGKSVLVSVLIGIIIALASYLIVDTIIRSLTNYTLSSLQSLSCQPQTTLSKGSPATQRNNCFVDADGHLDCPVGASTGGTGTGGDGTGLTHDQANLLLHPSITVTSSAGAAGVRDSCPETSTISSGGSTGCTTLDGMTREGVEALNRIQGACNCNITVTGANEPGHQTHKNGLNWDLAQTSDLNNYFNAVVQPTGVTRTTSIGNEYKDPRTGNCWLVEGNHYHISSNCKS